MAVRDGIERRHVSLPAEVWSEIDKLAEKSGVSFRVALREVVDAGLLVCPAHVLAMKASVQRRARVQARVERQIEREAQGARGTL